MQRVHGHAHGRGPRDHVGRLGLRCARIGAVTDEHQRGGHFRPGLQLLDAAQHVDDAVIERCRAFLGRQRGGVEQVGDAIVERGRGQQFSRPGGPVLVDGHVIELFLHIARRRELANSGFDGGHLVSQTTGGVDQEDSQRADLGRAVVEHFIDREAIVTDEERLSGKIERRACAVHAIELELDAGETLGIGVGDGKTADLARALGQAAGHHAEQEDKRGQQATRAATVGVCHESSPCR